MHWGHAVSSDLLHWKHKPIALYPGTISNQHDHTAKLKVHKILLMWFTIFLTMFPRKTPWVQYFPVALWGTLPTQQVLQSSSLTSYNLTSCNTIVTLLIHLVFLPPKSKLFAKGWATEESPVPLVAMYSYNVQTQAIAYRWTSSSMSQSSTNHHCHCPW